MADQTKETMGGLTVEAIQGMKPEEVKAMLDEHGQNIEGLKFKLSKAEGEAEAMKKAKEEAEAAYADLQFKFDKMGKEAEEFKSKHDDMIREHAALKDKHEQEVMDHLKTKAEAEALKAKHEDLKKAVDGVTAEAEAWKMKHASVTQSEAEARKRAEVAEATVEDMNKNEMARKRFAKLTSMKQVKPEDAEATLAELKGMSEETYAAVLKYASLSGMDSDKTGKDQTFPGDNPKFKDGYGSAEEKAIAEEAAKKAEEALATAKEVESPDLQATNLEDGKTNTFQAMASMLLGRNTETQE